MNLDDLFPKSPTPPKGLLYSYADGSANIYYITKDRIEYAPMTPMRSSSGTYSGGDPATVKINKGQFLAVKKVFELAALKTKDHIKDRVKMSGNISFVEEQKSYNLAYQSDSQKAIEIILKTLINSNR